MKNSAQGEARGSAAPATPPASRQGRGRAVARTAVGTLVSVGLLLLLFSGANVGEVWTQMRLFSFSSLLFAVAFALAGVPLRAVQWQWLLGKPPVAGFSTSLRSLSLGYLGNCLLPMRGGELVRTYLLSRSTSLSISRVFVSVVLTRVQDLPPVLLLLVLTLTMIELGDSITLGGAGFLTEPVVVPAAQLSQALNVFAIAVGAVAVAVVAGFIWREKIEGVLVRLNEWLPHGLARRLEGQIAQAVEAVRIVGRPRLFWGAQVVSFLCWVLFASLGVPLLLAIGVEIDRAFQVALVVLGMTVVAEMLPSLPAAVGTFHAACVLGLRLMEPTIDTPTAIAFALVFHFVSIIVPGMLGLLYLPTSWAQFMDALARRREGDSMSGFEPA